MTPATWPREDPTTTRLLHVDPARDTFVDHRISDLSDLLSPGDLVVVNDAATLPASLAGRSTNGGELEVRLAGQLDGERWRAVVFGAGDWRTRTEDRASPGPLATGEPIFFSGLSATVVAVDDETPRLIELVFDRRGDALYQALYRIGRPVQYAYLDGPLSLWHVQSVFAARPWSVEPPSAGLSITASLLLALRRRGVEIARVTHAAGLSSTGDASLDARLPFEERYCVPPDTAAAVGSTQARGGRVLAVGTTVARALEGAAAAHDGRLVAGEGRTKLRLGSGSSLAIVGGILTGIHDAESSHYALLNAFASARLLDPAHAFAASMGYREHEFGDALLVWSSRPVDKPQGGRKVA